MRIVILNAMKQFKIINKEWSTDKIKCINPLVHLVFKNLLFVHNKITTQPKCRQDTSTWFSGNNNTLPSRVHQQRTSVSQRETLHIFNWLIHACNRRKIWPFALTLILALYQQHSDLTLQQFSFKSSINRLKSCNDKTISAYLI